MSKLNLWKTWCAMSLLCATTAIALPAQTFVTLHSFDGTDGYNPWAWVIQATDGHLYGTTAGGAAYKDGTVYYITTRGVLTTALNFDGVDGAGTIAGLALGTDGNYYGTTGNGGTSGWGTVFKMTPSGAVTVLYNFCSQSGCADGANPDAGLIQATDGNLYGTTRVDGANGDGTIFTISLDGTFATLYSFCSQSGCSDGSGPNGLIQASNGDLYGTTGAGGTNGLGTVFRITLGGALTRLHSFCSQSLCPDGSHPSDALVQGSDGDLYGTTAAGGTLADEGTVFKITLSGALTTLHRFCQPGSCADGAYPSDALIQAADGNFYGTTTTGGTSDAGTIFELTPGGSLTTLHNFCGKHDCADGSYPQAALTQDTNGDFYGTTLSGGTGSSCSGGCGTVFSLATGLGPFVEAIPTFGRPGAATKILGTDLTGATSVSFNGTSAAFKVVSGSLITATVPPGAATGTVQVVTPSGTLASNVPFRVLP